MTPSRPSQPFPPLTHLMHTPCLPHFPGCAAALQERTSWLERLDLLRRTCTRSLHALALSNRCRSLLFTARTRGANITRTFLPPGEMRVGCQKGDHPPCACLPPDTPMPVCIPDLEPTALAWCAHSLFLSAHCTLQLERWVHTPLTLAPPPHVQA